MQKDLIRGKKGEQLIIELFEKNGHLAKSNDNKDLRSFYDIEFSLLDKTYHIFFEGSIEVKNDEYAKKSGNIAIEYYNSKSQKASGITVTRSDIWAQIAVDQVWFANVKQLRKFIAVNEPHRTIYGGGDKNADLLLFKIDSLFNNSLFMRVDQLTNDEFTNTIKKLIE